MAQVKVSVITVTFNAKEFVGGFLNSLRKLNLNGIELEVLLIDNGSSDGTFALIRDRYSEVHAIKNDENNYARALNLGIARSDGDYVVIANNDATAHADWLQGMLEIIQRKDRIGAVQSKILLSGSGCLNSVGVERTEHFYFRDIAFGEQDSPRYEAPAKRQYVSGGSVMFRRACLEDVGAWDEEYIMYMEDVDYSARCRDRGWELWFAPDSILYHHYHGSASETLCRYFCSRNRLFFVARHHPEELSACVPSSQFYKHGEFDLLYRSLLHAVRRMCEYHDTDTVSRALKSLGKDLPALFGDAGAHNFFSHLNLLLGNRRIRVGIYDHAGHFAGGGQRYAAEMAAIMQDRYEVTYIFNKEVQLSDYRKWFDIDLSRCDMKVVPIPFFDKLDCYVLDEGMVRGEISNPFDVVAEESLHYDIFINANMLSKVNPLSLLSIFLCHFPDQEMGRFFQVDKYDYLITNGEYSGRWCKKRWGLEPTFEWHPPVNMYNENSSPHVKEKIIVSVSRFEVSGSKRQLEMVNTFAQMCREHPERMVGWKLVLLGGSIPDNEYLGAVLAEVARVGCAIEVLTNAPVEIVREYYRRALVFWHACGLNETEPQRVEHFGMTTVEAMQNYCVPIVINGGGQKEIVKHGESGYRFSSIEQLKEFSFAVMGQRELCRDMAQKAYERSGLFSHEVFKGRMESLLGEIEAELLGVDFLPKGPG
jgi:GT2 family glycosyltransferase